MTHDPLVGKVIDGRYEILSRVGEGGMGVVYKARQISIDRVIALKMLGQNTASDPNWVQRFYNEAKACSRLQHPNTIRMFDFGQTSDGRLFMTMEFLDGISLRQALQSGPLAGQRVAKILIQCCASLAEAHSIGIIHRDIKPDNVFLMNMAGSPDFVKLLDFSVAKLLEVNKMITQAGVVFGTPQYMSPEQGRGLPLDARSDLYALGVLAFEMLTGRVPFHDENPMQVIQLHLHAAVPPLPGNVPPPLHHVVRRALEKDPQRRYQSAGEMMQQCQQVFAELAASSHSVGAAGMPRTLLAANLPPAVSQAAAQMRAQAPGAPAPPNAPAPPAPAPAPGALAYTAASPQQKTLLAAPNPFASAAAAVPAPAPNPAYVAASPGQKTMIAGSSMQPPMQPGMQQQPGWQQPGMPMQPGMQQQPGWQQPGMPMQPGMQQPGWQQPGMPMQPGWQQPGMPMQPGMQQPGWQQPGMPMQPGIGYATEGVPNQTVRLQPSEGVVSLTRGGHPLAAAGTAFFGQQATTLFWLVCLAIGVTIGAVAYVIVRQVAS